MNQLEIKKAQRIIYLVTADQKAALSEVEKEELENWLKLNPENLDLWNELKNAGEKEKALRLMNAHDVDASYGKLKTRIAAEEKQNKARLRYSWIAAAAAILIVISIAGYFYSPLRKGSKIAESLVVAESVAPGSNKATLTLADGRTVELSGDKHSVVMQSDKLTYGDGTAIINDANTDNRQPGKTGAYFAVITTPRGGQYQIVLSDGTKVWLNAASALKYPSAFDDDERVVTLSGEAYFEVAAGYTSPGRKKPFIVKTATQQVEVLGTHFNISGYPDEAAIRTTLIEGAVRVSQQGSQNAQMLKPNQQSIVVKDNENIKVIQVNPAYVVDWKNGDFIFDTDIRTIMRQISRWYNIEVAYEGEITKEEFGGRVLRSKNLAEVLNVLQQTNKVHFRIEDASSPGLAKRIVVMP